MADAKPPTKAQPQDWSRFIVQHTPGAVITTDARGRITEFNPAAEKITGYRREEAIGQPAETILYCQGSEAGSALDQVMSGKLEVTQELVLQQPHRREGAGHGQFLCPAERRKGPAGGGHHHSGPEPGQAPGNGAAAPGEHVRPRPEDPGGGHGGAHPAAAPGQGRPPVPGADDLPGNHRPGDDPPGKAHHQFPGVRPAGFAPPDAAAGSHSGAG